MFDRRTTEIALNIVGYGCLGAGLGVAFGAPGLIVFGCLLIAVDAILDLVVGRNVP